MYSRYDLRKIRVLQIDYILNQIHRSQKIIKLKQQIVENK